MIGTPLPGIKSPAVPLVLLVVFFIAGSHVRWEVLLTGFAWRAWLLMHSLPATLALARLASLR